MADEQKNPTAEPAETFDSLMGRLQHIVEQLERADLPLEESLKAFEVGVELSRKGQTILDSAEKRVEVLLQDGSTKLVDPDA